MSEEPFLRRTTQLLLKRQAVKRQALAVILIMLAVASAIGIVFVAGAAPVNRQVSGEFESNGAMGIDLLAVGDVSLGLDVAPVLDQKGYDYPWSAEKQAISQADIALCNLESALTTRGAPHPSQTSFHQRGDPAAVTAMRDAGIDLVVLANDHVMDYGDEGLADTISALDRAGIAHCGAGFNRAQAHSPAVMEIAGARVAFLAFSSYVPDGYAAEDDRPGIAALTDIAALEDEIEKARAVSDYVVVYFHWGETGVESPSVAQSEIAHAAARAGASLVLGAHPHVLQGMERYADTLIAYSLGNFIFNPPKEEGRLSGLLKVTLAHGRLDSAEFEPAYITYCQPFPARGSKGEDILARMAALSAQLGTELDCGGEVGSVKF
ncbi:MAG: CapA family protein [Candidatus Geothermincolia bacterium]